MSQIGELRKAERAYCKDHIEYFIQRYGHIEDKDAEELIQPFDLWQAQKDALRSIMEHRLNIILKARQLGFSWLAIHLGAHTIVTSGGKTVIGLSRTEEEAKELVRRLGVVLAWMPELIADKDHLPPNWDGPVYKQLALSITIEFPDEPPSIFQAMASSPSAGRSFTANLIIIDEWAFQQYAREIWKAAYPTINRPDGGKVVGLSTIERGSLFEEIFTNPDNGFNKIFIPWYADPRRDEAWYERTKLAMGDDITSEYPATIEEALMVPGGSFFPEVTKKTHESDSLMTGPVTRYCHLDYGLDMLSAHWTVVDTEGNSQTYREVDEPNLTASQAAQMVLSRSAGEYIDAWLAPPDLWNRNRDTGKSTADIFAEYGIPLTKVSNDFVNGCILLKELLRVNPETGKCKHTFLKDTCPNAIKCLQKIQKDKLKPAIYAKNPHELTHDVDSMRYFSVWWVAKAKEPSRKRKNGVPTSLKTGNMQTKK